MSPKTALLPSVFGFATVVQAQTVTQDSASLSALRDVFRGRQAINVLMLETVPTPELAYTLTAGVGYTDAQGGNSVTSAPGELAINFHDGKALFLVDGEYGLARSPFGNTSGWGDPSFSVVYRITPKGTDSFAVAGSVSIPSGTDVSAGAAAQSLALLWNHTFASTVDSMRLTIQGDHVNDSLPSGISAYTSRGKIYYEHTFADDAPIADIFLNASCAHTGGVGNATVVGGGIDFALVREPVGPFKNIIGTLLGFCKVSSGGRCGHIEFDLTLPLR